MILGKIISLILLLSMLYFIAKHPFFQLRNCSSWLLPGIFILKLLAMFFLWGVYTFYYLNDGTADIFKYFIDAQNLKAAINGNWQLLYDALCPWRSNSVELRALLPITQYWDLDNSFLINDNRTMIRLNLLLHFISGGYFQLHALVFTFLSFMGSFALFKFFKNRTQLSNGILLVGVFLIPSTLLWSSSVLKESWLFFSLGFFTYFLERFMAEKKMRHLFLSAVFLFLLLGIKPYLILALFPALLFLIVKQYTSLSALKAFLLTHLLLLFVFFVTIGDVFLQQMANKLEDFNNLALQSNAGSFFKMPIYHNWAEFFYNLPMGLYNVFIRPIFPPQWNLLSLMSSLEGIMLISLLLFSLFFFKLPKGKQLTTALFCLSFILFLSILIGMTTPVLGAIVRYKVPLIPFYVILLLTFVNPNKFPFLKSKR